MRNSIKFLTTRKERDLVRMQADKNVILLNKKDTKDKILRNCELT